MFKKLARVSFRTVSIEDCDCGAPDCETKVVTGFLEVILFSDRVCFAVESEVLGRGEPGVLVNIGKRMATVEYSIHLGIVLSLALLIGLLI